MDLFMYFRFLKIVCFIFIFFTVVCTAHAFVKNHSQYKSMTHSINKPIHMELQNINLPDAIRIIAKFLNINVMINPSVSGTVNLNLKNVGANEAMDLLLSANGLSKWQIDNIWLIAPQKEILERKEAELKSQTYRDEKMPLKTRVWRIHYANAQQIADLIQGKTNSLLSKQGWLQVDARSNTICIRDKGEQLRNIRMIIDQLDVPVPQISIEARLVNIDHDVEHELGLQFSTTTGEGEHKDSNLYLLDQGGQVGLAVAKLADRSLLDVKLSALESDGRAELISSPSLFTANQQTASIEAGEEVPYQETSDNGGTTIVFKKAVLGLKVTPQILPGKMVLLQLQINQDKPSNKIILGVPTISTRQMITSVLIKSGQTMVLGGIYETNHENGQQTVPFLSKIPLLGWLFKQLITRENKRELLIFIRPKIVAQIT